MFTLRCPSMETSIAPASISRANDLCCDLLTGSLASFSARAFHSVFGYIHKQLSRPLVITTSCPMSLRNFVGRAILPFSSSTCWNSPMNIVFKNISYPQMGLIIPTFIHFLPLSLYFTPLMLYGQEKGGLAPLLVLRKLLLNLYQIETKSSSSLE